MNVIVDFPSSHRLEQLRNPSNLVQIKTFLHSLYDEELRNSELFPRFPYRFYFRSFPDNTYIRVKCRFCSCFLGFKKTNQNQSFTLTKFSISHSHETDFILTKKEKVFKYLNSIQGNDVQSERKYIQRKFNLSDKYIKKLFSQYLKGESKNIQQLKEKLAKQDIYYYYWPLSSKVIQNINLYIKSIFIKGPSQKIKYIKLSNNKLTDQGFVNLIPYLSSVTNLNLSNNLLTEKVLQQISKNKDKLSPLRIINLKGNLFKLVSINTVNAATGGMQGLRSGATTGVTNADRLKSKQIRQKIDILGKIGILVNI